jgi:hypothetical protein
MFGSFFRVFSFMGQVLGMIGRSPMLLAPLAINILAAVPLHIALVAISFLLPEEYSFVQYLFMFVACASLYFVDYFSAGLNTSMIADAVTTGQPSLGNAFSRTLKASPGILIFALVSALFDLLENVANNQRGMIRTILIGLLRTVWTTATYVMMPSMVIENLGFVGSFKRSKELMENDPTQVGVGVVGMGLITWILSTGIFFVANYLAFGLIGQFSPALGMVAGLFLINVSWALSGFLKSTYFTCYYLWASECARNGRASTEFAPAPLRSVLGDVTPGSF